MQSSFTRHFAAHTQHSYGRAVYGEIASSDHKAVVLSDFLSTSYQGATDFVYDDVDNGTVERYGFYGYCYSTANRVRDEIQALADFWRQLRCEMPSRVAAFEAECHHLVRKVVKVEGCFESATEMNEKEYSAVDRPVGQQSSQERRGEEPQRSTAAALSLEDLEPGLADGFQEQATKEREITSAPPVIAQQASCRDLALHEAATFDFWTRCLLRFFKGLDQTESWTVHEGEHCLEDFLEPTQHTDDSFPYGDETDVLQVRVQLETKLQCMLRLQKQVLFVLPVLLGDYYYSDEKLLPDAACCLLHDMLVKESLLPILGPCVVDVGTMYRLLTIAMAHAPGLMEGFRDTNPRAKSLK